jgi:hypothetical protein
LKTFEEIGLLKNIILIGSWCLVFYQLIFEGFRPQVRTTDIDFYVPDAQYAEPGDATTSLKRLNYDHIRDTLTNKSTFISPDGFEIEFLTNLNKDGLSAVRLGSSEIYAESLSYLGIYSTHYVELTYFGIRVKVASPAAFVIQKILINERRGSKTEKDKEAILYVATFVGSSRKTVEDFQILFGELPRKWKAKVLLFFKSNDVNLPQKTFENRFR